MCDSISCSELLPRGSRRSGNTGVLREWRITRFLLAVVAPNTTQASSLFIQQLALRLVPQIYPPHENVVTEGEMGKEMYFILQADFRRSHLDPVTYL